MLDFFNFHHPFLETPPALPAAPLDPAGLAQCAGMPTQGSVGM
jgi:hypothetical protein